MTTQTHKWLPSEPSEEMIEAAGGFGNVYKAMWKAAPEVEQEPVAFMAVDENHGTRLCHREIIAECWGIPYVPLYTHPQPNHNVNAELLGVLRDMVEMVEMNGFGKAYVMDVAKRAIEKAHGIGVE